MKPLIRRRSPGMRRSACLAAVLATAGALLTAPAAQADTGNSDQPVRLTAGALDKLSDRYTPRSDGTPGIVAKAAEGADGMTAPHTKKQQSKAGVKATGKAAAGENTTGAAASSFREEASWETARGVASTLTLGGTRDWVGVFSGGTVARYDADGDPVWQRTSHSLYTDWEVKPKNPRLAEEFTPVLYEGYNPYQPSTLGRHPFAQADFNGDGVGDVAVAYSVGAKPLRDFTSPGSDLQTGTFVSLLDGRTGSMLWHKLLPGYVGSLAAQDGKLIAANVTGPQWQYNPVDEQGDSRSSLIAYTFDPAAHGKLTGHTAWTYSTKAPWALWTDIEPMGKGRITVGWTDTPMGLGSDRPAAGHVMVLGTDHGRVVTDVKTPGYPRIVTKDPGADRVLVAEQNDPFNAVRWALTAIDVTTGERSVLASRDNTIPEAFVVNAGAHGKQARYAVAELAINADLTDGQSSISGWDAEGHTIWSRTTKSTVGGANAPTLSLMPDSRGHGHIFAAIADPTQQTLAHPEGPTHSHLVAFDARNGRTVWSREGAVVGDQITRYHGDLLTVGYNLTAYRVDRVKGRATPSPLLGDTYAGAAADVNHDGVEDLVVGGQSHGVFALDGRSLDQPTPHILWHQAVGATVHQLQIAKVKDRKGRSARRVVAATSHGFAVLATDDGRPVADVDTGAFQQKVAVVGGHIVASGTKLSAYTADGHKVWSYRPEGTRGKKVVYSVPATDNDGRIFVEYGGIRTKFGTGPSDPAPTAVALDATDGSELWSHTPDTATAAWIEQQSGVFAGPEVPGADGHAVAFAWGGDDLSTRAHLVQTLDGRTGKVLTSDDSVGAATFQGFAASPKYGLVEIHMNMLTVYPADGGKSYRVRTMANVWQGTFAHTPDGTQTFVAGVVGVLQYVQPFPQDDSQYTYSDNSTFALAAGSVTPVGSEKGKGSRLLALQRDWAAYNLNQQIGGFGSETHATDSYQHGITVVRIAGSDDADSGRSHRPATLGKAPTTGPVENPTLPIGRAVTPMHVHKTRVVKEGAAETTVPGYTPQQIRSRLGLTGDGSGQTVAITAAYHYANAKADLNHFSEHFKLPQTCDSTPEDTGCFTFEQVYATGDKPAPNINWSQEAALDIEWVHSVVPKARIVLVEAASASATDLYKAVDVAATYEPAAVNNSWGMSEFSEESYYDAHCKLKNSVCTQSTGDRGYPAGYSSTNPYALAVGGTTLVLDKDGNTHDESAWASTGGGLSYFEKRPAYQDEAQSSGYRATPDVSFVADPRTGVAVYTTATGTPRWMEAGGTSLSSPIWAGIIAAADQLRAGKDKPPLAVAGPNGDTAHASVYALGDALSDITTGENGLCGTECTAGPGYDTVTGLGSPQAGVDKALAAMN